MCTRILYVNDANVAEKEEFKFVARTLDWNEDTGTHLWLYPKGMRRDGGFGSGSIEWVSRYTSIVASIYDRATVDGMNDEGLVANMLYLAEASYDTARGAGKPKLSIGAWPQYMLDNFATVADAVAAMREEPFRIVAPNMPNKAQDKAGAHLALSDKNGDSAIFEYVCVRKTDDGTGCAEAQLIIHHGADNQVMTNSPTYDAQLAIRDYWMEAGGNWKPEAVVTLPGTHRAADRFVRASYNLTLAPKADVKKENEEHGEHEKHTALAAALSMARAISVPVGLNDPGKPNNSTTIWRTVSDPLEKTYYFDSVYSPTVFWVKLDKFKLLDGGGALKLELTHKTMPAGNATGLFKPAKPFPWLTERVAA